MWPLASAFVDIAIHRRGPEDLPASDFLVALLFPLYLLSGLGVLWMDSTVTSAQVLFGLVEACVYIGFVWVLLRVAEKRARFPQTASAVLGTSIGLNLLAMPLRAWHDALTASETETSIALYVLLGLLLWAVDISGFILSRALDQPYIVGVLIVVLYFMASQSIATALPLS